MDIEFLMVCKKQNESGPYYSVNLGYSNLKFTRDEFPTFDQALTHAITKYNENKTPVKNFVNTAGSKFKLENDKIFVTSKDGNVWWPTGWDISELNHMIQLGQIKEI